MENNILNAVYIACIVINFICLAYVISLHFKWKFPSMQLRVTSSKEAKGVFADTASAYSVAFGADCKHDNKNVLIQ